MPRLPRLFALLAALLPLAALPALPPNLSYQGRVTVDGANFDGSGQFKFALVDAAGSVTYWSNDGSSVAGSAPSAAVSLSVAKGLYSVLLGDTGLANMTALPPSVFTHGDVRLRIWFSDGAHGFQLLTPDQPLASAGYAFQAGTVDDGAISAAKLAPGAAAAPVGATGGLVATSANATYSANGSTASAFALPTAANVGDTVQFTATGSGGWTVALPSASWRARETVRNWRSVATSAEGSRLIAAVNGGFLYTSTDRGLNWTQRETSRSWRWVASSANGQRLAAVAGTNQVFVSTDAGGTWTPKTTAASQLGAVVSSADGLRLVATAVANSIHLSTDGGESWTLVYNGASNGWINLSGSADLGRIVAADGGTGTLISGDGGGTWVRRGPSGFVAATACSADGLRLVATTSDGRTHISADGGLNWTQRDVNSGGGSDTGLACSADGNRICVAPIGQFLRVSSDAGATWSNQESPRSWKSVAMSRDGSTRIAVASPSTIYVSGSETSGGAGSVTQFQYLGNGLWGTVSPQVAAGSVGSTQLAAGSVGSVHLQAGLSLSGTTNALGSLVVDGNGANTGSLLPGLLFGSPTSGEGIAARRSAGTGQFGLSLFTAGTQQVTILNNGNVGIGTSNPTLGRLQVVGNASLNFAYAYYNSSTAIGLGSGTVPISIHASDRNSTPIPTHASNGSAGAPTEPPIWTCWSGSRSPTTPSATEWPRATAHRRRSSPSRSKPSFPRP